MQVLLEGLGTMFALIGLAIGMDIVLNDADSITKIICTLRGEVWEDEDED